MATRKKGVITPALAAPPWLVHLRPDGKKQFWKRERQEQKKLILEVANGEDNPD